jgi:hypothetical protein
VHNLLEEYVKHQSERLVSSKEEKQQQANSVNEILKHLQDLTTNYHLRETLLPILLQKEFMLPSRYKGLLFFSLANLPFAYFFSESLEGQKIFPLPNKLVRIWEPAIKKFNGVLPKFITILVEFMLEKLSKGSSFEIR